MTWTCDTVAAFVFQLCLSEMLSWASKGQSVDVETCLQASPVLPSHCYTVPDPWESPANSKAVFMATEDTCIAGTGWFLAPECKFYLEKNPDNITWFFVWQKWQGKVLNKENKYGKYIYL